MALDGGPVTFTFIEFFGFGSTCIVFDDKISKNVFFFPINRSKCF